MTEGDGQARAAARRAGRRAGEAAARPGGRPDGAAGRPRGGMTAAGRARLGRQLIREVLDEEAGPP